MKSHRGGTVRPDSLESPSLKARLQAIETRLQTLRRSL
jgi:hypothetical protein